MNLSSSILPTVFHTSGDANATLRRLIGNLRGFAYRRRHDARWTMEFVSSRCRDVTGFDSHRFIDNASIAFADLIARADWKRVNEAVNLAVLRRQRIAVQYRLRAAHGATVFVEDRLTPVSDDTGGVVAIEGIIDLAHGSGGRSR